MLVVRASLCYVVVVVLVVVVLLVMKVVLGCASLCDFVKVCDGCAC